MEKFAGWMTEAFPNAIADVNLLGARNFVEVAGVSPATIADERISPISAGLNPGVHFALHLSAVINDLGAERFQILFNELF